jgi:hypothetical protein
LGKGIKLRFMLGGTYYLTSGKIGGLVGREGRRDVKLGEKAGNRLKGRK